MKYLRPVLVVFCLQHHWSGQMRYVASFPAGKTEREANEKKSMGMKISAKGYI
jgi:hypothetical protein